MALPSSYIISSRKQKCNQLNSAWMMGLNIIAYLNWNRKFSPLAVYR